MQKQRLSLNNLFSILSEGFISCYFIHWIQQKSYGISNIPGGEKKKENQKTISSEYWK